MKVTKLITTGLIVWALTCFLFVGSVLAGGGFEIGPNPPEYVDPGSIDNDGPEAWAVISIECLADPAIRITVRAKQLVDCDVKLQSVSWEDTWPDATPYDENTPSCPTTESALKDRLLYLGFPGWSWFSGSNVITSPVITKIKNIDKFAAGALNTVENAFTFDAQIKNFVPQQ